MTKNNNVDTTRRNFLKLTGLGGAALCLGFYFPADGVPTLVRPSELSESDIELCPWIIINPSGKVTIVNHRAEMGQGSYHSVPQIVAEELEVDMKDINVIFAIGNEKKYGGQVTGGSSTIRSSYKNLLKLSATAREMLIAAAAAKWNVSVADCYAESGHVIHKPSGKKAHYGELAVAASKLSAPKEPKLKKISEYKLIRKPLKRIDTPLKTNGSLIFGLDKRIPGMLFASVERDPRYFGKVKSFDASKALKVPGVKRVFKVNMGYYEYIREGVAVIADSTWAALEGRKALKVEWDTSSFKHWSTPEIFETQNKLLKTQEGMPLKTQGNPTEILSKKTKKLDVVYQTPYQSHVAMEPINCIAHYKKDSIEIWGPIQAPGWIQDDISKQFKIDKEKVIVNMTFLGGGFGRKAMIDYPSEAVGISKILGGPVQVVWTREDDATLGPFRPGISYRCEGTIADGKIEALKFRMAGQNNDHWRGGSKTEPNRSTSEGFLKPYYESIKNLSISDVLFETTIPTSFWRSVYASTNGFAYESFIDEMAYEAGKDPMKFRREHLQEERCQKLIDKMEEVSGWKNRSKNEGFGVAITECFNSTVGHVVKVSKNLHGGVKIDKVWAVMDCGWYVNPDIIHAQVEGSIVMGLGAATTHQITFKDNVVEQHNFYDYPLPRINEIPPIEVYIIDNEEDAGGVGEPGLPPFAPALTNAIFDLTGKRIRTLPFKLSEV
ncbi:molybdopterin cofactor-binding domain-containing protein [Flavobacterium pectinovorum]|uniref:Isoquinoline 1-oxidoreductase, beta subunit n=1 Tax=Flavobacterium pectinovorum TaxID=29533 RepID=A0AB36NZA0_9FLAO|nr:molybdopterin cofactor-binding domain-containing protein [Flavobacterium pectinovorum]OXB03675.1 xanthine dehydrogenase [Flavobacterium pectinovorum]SHL62444.1 isoquinoline 1-oxidoreductase, beta subunit [Flavobacterium pectinovorum]